MAQSLATSGDIDNYSFFREIESLERVVKLQPGNTAALDMLAYDLIEAGYLQEAVGVAQQLVELEPLAIAAHGRLSESLLAVGRYEEAQNALAVAIDLGGDILEGAVAFQYALDGRSDVATPHLATWFERYEVPASFADEFIDQGSDVETGAMFLDEKIPLIIDTVPDEAKSNIKRLLLPWYGVFGHLDRYFEIILEIDPGSSTWTEADDLMFFANLMRRRGTAEHPKYLAVAESMGIVALWEQRGPPDFCVKANRTWTCN